MRLDRHVLRARRRLAGQAGFSLIELLVVVLIIGIIAGIALPMFLDQRKKAMDVSAKSSARNLAAEVEGCFVPQQNFGECDGAGAGDALTADGLRLGTDPGEVSVSAAGDDWYEVTAVSKATSDGANHTYSIRKELRRVHDRTCVAGSSNDKGACSGGTW
jgi:type IV pilus assembly protein PilA